MNFANLASFFLRLALGVTFLYSFGDRFGMWGPYGSAGVSWGDFNHFLLYTEKITAFMPHRLTPMLAWGTTILELLFGVCLIVGLCTRLVAAGSGLLLLTYALSMTATTGLSSALTYSVFSASGGALLLANSNVWLGVDNLLEKSRFRMWNFPANARSPRQRKPMDSLTGASHESGR